VYIQSHFLHNYENLLQLQGIIDKERQVLDLDVSVGANTIANASGIIA